MAAVKKSELYSALWASCDALRGGMDASQYKDYILTLLFVKYVTDKFKGQPYSDIEVPEGGSFDDMVELINKKNIGEEMDKIIARLAEANNLRGVIDNAHFNDEQKLGKGQEMVDKLSKLVNIFRRDELNFKNNRADGDDIIGDAYEYLMRKFATESGKSKGQFYTPAEVSRVLAKVIGIGNETNPNATVYDPACGSGSLLIRALNEAPIDLAGYGQEKESTTAGLAIMNCVLHGKATTVIKADNTFSNPQYFEDEAEKTVLKRFDYIVANPPFSLKNWTDGLKPYGRFDGYDGAMPPENKGDYAWLMHILKSLKENGKAAVILPHGVLFRGNTEETIRKKIIDKGYIKGIISLPPNLFYGTPIAACIIVLDKSTADTRDHIFIVDASHGFMKDKDKNRLREQDVYKIVHVFTNEIEGDPKYARKVPISEITGAKNNYNLNIPRYIDSAYNDDAQDLDAHMNGGIPMADVDSMTKYWSVLTGLKTKLFSELRKGYYKLNVEIGEISDTIYKDSEFETYSDLVDTAFMEWQERVDPLLRNPEANVDVKSLITTLSDTILEKFEPLELLDKYDVYQVLLGYWQDVMADDVYLISHFGFEIARELEYTYGTKEEKDEKGNKVKVEDKSKVKAWEGQVIPKKLLIDKYFASKAEAIKLAEDAVQAAAAEIDEKIENVEEGSELGELIEDGKVDEKKLTARMAELKKDIRFSIDAKERYEELSAYKDLLQKKKDATSEAKGLADELDNQLKAKYALLALDEIKELVVNKKWYYSIYDGIDKLFRSVARNIANRINTLARRYEYTLGSIDDEIESTSKELYTLVSELCGDEFDSAGIEELKKLLGGV